MTFVLDASLALAFILKDEASAETDKILDTFGRGAKAFTLPLWRWEVGNVLLMAERRKRITSAETERHLALLKLLPIEIDEAGFEEAWGKSLVLAKEHNLTCYDAAYLELAIRRKSALGTLDRDLRAAAKAAKIPVLPDKI